MLHSFDLKSPEFFTCLKKGYTKKTLFKDLLAGLSIGLISLPLVMAFAIAAGLPPERGLYTGIIAGLLISLLGGSRVQIGGPTGAFAIVIFATLERHGYEGLVLATILAGAIMILIALFNAGALLKFIPYPVVTGFTAGLAINIFSSQVKDFFGMPIGQLPSDFLSKWTLYLEHFGNAAWNGWALGIGLAALSLIFYLRKKFPLIPGATIAVFLGTFLGYAFEFPLETIETKFGSIPSMLPMPSLPFFSLEQIKNVLPDAFTIAILASVEVLLSAVVADRMTGFRHHSGTELAANGLANIVSAIFGGIPATGAIARTAANVKLGATTPLAGVIHALTLFILMVCFASAAAKIPLAIMAACLIFVAWNMSEKAHIALICKGSKSDILMLFVTIFLTVFVDITVAVEVGVLLAAVLFMNKMAAKTKIAPVKDKESLPHDIAIYEVNGPLFFGISDTLHQQFEKIQPIPRAFIFHMKHAHLIDASGIHALQEVAGSCKKHDIQFLISGVKEDNLKLFKTTGLEKKMGKEAFCKTLDEAIYKTKEDATKDLSFKP